MNQQELELFDLYGLWYEPFWQKPWFWVVISAFALLFILFLFYWFFKKKRQSVVIKSPSQEALEQLNLLNVLSNTPELRKEFYLNLTALLKRYLMRRYGLSLASKTDEEVLMVIKTSEFPVERFADLYAIFNGAVYIKFADRDAAFDQMDQDLKRSITIINYTAEPSPLDTSGKL